MICVNNMVSAFVAATGGLRYIASPEGWTELLADAVAAACMWI